MVLDYSILGLLCTMTTFNYACGIYKKCFNWIDVSQLAIQIFVKVFNISILTMNTLGWVESINIVTLSIVLNETHGLT